MSSVSGGRVRGLAVGAAAVALLLSGCSSNSSSTAEDTAAFCAQVSQTGSDVREFVTLLTQGAPESELQAQRATIAASVQTLREDSNQLTASVQAEVTGYVQDYSDTVAAIDPSAPLAERASQYVAAAQTLGGHLTDLSSELRCSTASPTS